MGQTPNTPISVAALHLHEPRQRDVDLDTVLHPGRVFARPSDVVSDPDLSLREKRAILASWASDACAIESAPALRSGPAGGQPVTFDEVMDALMALDGEPRAKTYKSDFRRRQKPLPFAKGRIWRGFRTVGATRRRARGRATARRARTRSRSA